MNHLEQVEQARAALEAHQTNHPIPQPDENPSEWWAKRMKLIEAVLTSERAAIEAGEHITETTEF